MVPSTALAITLASANPVACPGGIRPHRRAAHRSPLRLAARAIVGWGAAGHLGYCEASLSDFHRIFAGNLIDLLPSQLLWQSKASGAIQTGCGTLGLSSIGAVSGLSAHFTAGSSQLIHCKSVRPAMVITGTIRFPHFRQHVVRSIKSSPVFPP
jgi:hypothetical protein